MNDYTKFGIGLAVVAAIFGILWWMGYLLRLTNYVQETKEELKKCSWPTVDELKGSTAVVMITILMLGVFIVGVDFLITVIVSVLNNINKTA